MLTGDMLRRSARRFPDKVAIIWGAERTSYRALNEAANRFAHALLARRLAKGAKIGMMCRNRTEYGIVFFGTAKSGFVLANVSVLYAPDELEYVLNKADVELLLFEDIFAEKIAAIRPRCPRIKTYVAIGAAVANAIPMAEFVAGAPAHEPAIALDEHDPFCMTYTGGTTGRPKGVLASHRARAATAHTVMHEEALDERDVVGIVTPMFHVAALNIMFQPAILAGATTMLLAKWSTADFIDMAVREGMTACFMVPSQASMLIQDPNFDPALLTHWTKLSFAGAPMPDWVQRALMEKLPALRLTQIYGQSEMGVICALRPWSLPAKLGAVGRQAYNTEIRVVRPDGTPIAADNREIGEVIAKGDNLMLEYYGEPEQSAGFFKLKDGWGWSGDLATIDAEGFVTLVDRSKEMLISGGENVYPKEIENILYLHDAVAECAVFGIPDAQWGEVPAAHVALKPGARATADELIAHCAQHLARFKRPRLIEFVTDFPKTPIGKIQKTVLKERYWTERQKKI